MNLPLLALAILCGVLSASVGAADRFVEASTVKSPYAHQAAAADERFLYAIASERVVRIDRQSGVELAVSTGKAKHLNSGFFWERKLYCAHSNYPRKPERSEIMVLDPETMRLSSFKNFGEYKGSLTWVVRKADAWWCNFAQYGADNAQTTLVKLDDEWNELGSWTYPPEVVRELGRYSISGGIWWNGDLLVTGHDRRSLYRLRLPETGTVLEFVAVLASPYPGQGIAADPVSGGLVGINRLEKRIILAVPDQQSR